MARYQQSVVTVPAAGGQILSASPDRIGVVFGSPVTNRYTITPNANPVLDAGINVFPGNNPLHFYKQFDGGAPGRAWFGISAVADQVIAIGEIYE